MTMRLPETEERYQQAKRDGKLVSLLEVPRLADYTYWAKIPNEFAHDRVAEKHDLLVLKRECEDFWHITDEEWKELKTILASLNNGEYNSFKVNFTNTQSIKGLPHIHLFRYLPEFR